MLPAANLLPGTQDAIERYLVVGRRELRKAVRDFLAWLARAGGKTATAAQAQRRFTFLQLRFNAVITQFDLFNDVISQRSENETGVWLSGLDVVSADALALPGGYYEVPPIICYLDRGIGAAIRRARTRLPGGGENPVAIIRVPRERMVGSGIASSLVHEVGHQAAALLDLVNSLRPVLQGLQRGRASERAGLAAVGALDLRDRRRLLVGGALGVASTMGLMGVVSLPRAFVFRLNVDDPHPVPWIRVKLSCAMGKALYPHPQWARLADLWESFYPSTRSTPSGASCWRSCRTACRPSSRCSSITGRRRCAGARWPRRSACRAPAGAAGRAVPRLEPRTRTDVSRLADAGVRRARPGAR